MVWDGSHPSAVPLWLHATAFRFVAAVGIFGNGFSFCSIIIVYE